MGEAMPYLCGEASGKVVAITFDDGYSDTFEHALPILQHYGFTATCYFVSQRIGQHNVWDAQAIRATKPLMNEENVRQWRSAGMEVGAHSQTHPHLNRCSDSELLGEIGQSRLDLEQLIQQPVSQFCYPYGSFDPRVAAAVKAAGFAAATTTRRGRATAGSDLYSLPRIMVAGHHLLPVLAGQLLTRYEDKRGLR